MNISRIGIIVIIMTLISGSAIGYAFENQPRSLRPPKTKKPLHPGNAKSPVTNKEFDARKELVIRKILKQHELILRESLRDIKPTSRRPLPRPQPKPHDPGNVLPTPLTLHIRFSQGRNRKDMAIDIHHTNFALGGPGAGPAHVDPHTFISGKLIPTNEANVYDIHFNAHVGKIIEGHDIGFNSQGTTLLTIGRPKRLAYVGDYSLVVTLKKSK